MKFIIVLELRIIGKHDQKLGGVIIGGNGSFGLPDSGEDMKRVIFEFSPFILPADLAVPK